MFRSLTLILIPLLLMRPSIANAKAVLNLKQSVHLALEHSPIYINVKNQLELSELNSKNAFSSFLPSIDLSSSHGLRGINPDTTGLTAVTPWVSSASLSLTENFYDNGESTKKYRIAEYKYELAKLSFQKVRAELIRSVVLAYDRYLISIRDLKFTEKNFSELDRLAKLVGNQFHQGYKTQKDFLSFKTKAQRGRLDLIQAEKDLDLAKSSLQELIGLNMSEETEFDNNEKLILPKKEIAINFDAASLYEIKIFNITQEISQIEIDLAKRKFWPEIDLVGAASYGSSDYVDTHKSWSDNDQSQWSVLLNIKFNIVDWGVRNRNIQAEALNQSNLEQTARSQVLLAEKDLESFKLEVKSASEEYQLSKELQKMEEDTFKLLERDYRSGKATYLELVTGLSNLLDAQSRGQQADYHQADLYLKWKYYTGSLNEETVFE